MHQFRRALPRVRRAGGFSPDTRAGGQPSFLHRGVLGCSGGSAGLLGGAQEGLGVGGTRPRAPGTARKPGFFLLCISFLLLIPKFLCISLSGSNSNTCLQEACGVGPWEVGADSPPAHRWRGSGLRWPSGLCSRRVRWDARSVFVKLPFFKQILYMYINRRQIDTTYFLYFVLHFCVPGLNLSRHVEEHPSAPGCVEEGAAGWGWPRSGLACWARPLSR